MQIHTQESSEEKSQANGSEPSLPQLGRGTTHKEPDPDSLEQSPETEGQASVILSEMAQSMSQAVEVALLNLELRRADEIKVVKQELRDSKLNEILQGWTETQQQIAELMTNMSEQRAGLAATNETLSQLCAETEKAQQLQISRIDSILERVTVQEAELPKLKNLTGISRGN